MEKIRLAPQSDIEDVTDIYDCIYRREAELLGNGNYSAALQAIK